MLKKERYNINKFYVGELYLSHQMSYKDGNEFYDYIENIKKMSLISFNGGIRFQKDIFNRYIDFEKNKAYEGVLTVFYKSREGYLCLHDGKTYMPNDDSFCENLIPLSNLLPKINFNIPNEISIKEATSLFDFLFKKKNKTLSDVKYDVDNFYVGDFILHEGYLPKNDKNNRYKYDSLTLKYILINSGADTIGMFGKEDSEYNLHDFTQYKCLFFNHPLGIYNFNSYSFCNIVSESKEFTSYCENLESLRKISNEKNIYIPNQITIPKILKLQKRISD